MDGTYWVAAATMAVMAVLVGLGYLAEKRKLPRWVHIALQMLVVIVTLVGLLFMIAPTFAQAYLMEGVSISRTDDVAGMRDFLEDFGPPNTPWPLHETSPLHVVRSPEMTRLLLQHGANPNATDRRRNTPLHRAAAAGRTEICKLLLQSGANVSAVNRERKTAAQLAREAGHPATAEFLEAYARRSPAPPPE